MSREPYDPMESIAQSLRDICDSLDAIVGAVVNPAGVGPAEPPPDVERLARLLVDECAYGNLDAARAAIARAALLSGDAGGTS